MNIKNLMHNLTLLVEFVLNLTTSRPMAGQDAAMKPWENPCVFPGHRDPRQNRPSGFGVTFSVPTKTLSLEDQLRELVIRCSEGLEAVQTLRKIMVSKGRVFDELSIFLNKQIVPGFPLRKDMESWDTTKPFEPVLEKDNIVFQKAVVFLLLVRDEENIKSAGALSADITKVIDKLYGIMCEINSISNGNSTGVVTYDVIPNAVRNLTSTAERFKRDFMISRDLGDILSFRKITYNDMFRHQSQ